MRGERLDNEKIPERLVGELDAAAERLEPGLLARLAHARRQAVAVAEKRQLRFFIVPRWVTAGGLATTAVLVIASSIWFSGRQEKPAAMPGDDLEIVSTQDHLDMYEDLDFYLWLAEKGQKHD